MIISHRGYGKGKNPVNLFNRALKLGADAIECDLRLTKDNKVVVFHDKILKVGDRRIKISKSTLSEIKKICKDTSPLTLDELLDFAKARKVPLFLEVKTSSHILIDAIADKVEERRIWPLVYVIGFSFFIRTALKLQSKYPKMRVFQFLSFPKYSYIRKPPKSYGVFLGWVGGWFYPSKWLFKAFIPPQRLAKLNNYYSEHGFKVMAGVINNNKAFRVFKEAGIEDIVTDNIPDAVSFLKPRN